MKSCVVIPAYNEEKSIATILRDVRSYVDIVIVVDDGSTDATFTLAERFSDIIVLRHRINLGKGAALKTGCEAALLSGADAIVFLDSDQQHQPRDIPRFIERLEQGECDIVFGSRKITMDMPFAMIVGNKFLSLITNLLFGIYITDTQSGFRAFRSQVYSQLMWESSGYSVETEMVVNVGKHRLKFCEIGIQTIYLDKYKGTTVFDGLRIFFQMLMWKIL